MHTDVHITPQTAKLRPQQTGNGDRHIQKKLKNITIDIGRKRQFLPLKVRAVLMIAELLDIGERSALPSAYLCKILGISRRQLAREVEKERRSGAFICANGDGFFIAESVPEFRAYLRTLESRARELDTTREALIAAAGRMGVAGF